MNDKEKILKQNINEIAELDEAILSIGYELKELQVVRVQLMDTPGESKNDPMKPVPTSSSLKKSCQKPQVHSPLCVMRILRQNIATQKAQIMKNLELNSNNKLELDEDIAKLQNMQKQYMLLEKDMVYKDETPNRTDFCLSSDEGDVSSEDFLRSILGDAHSISGVSRDDKEKMSVSAVNSGEHRSVTFQRNSIITQNSLNINSEFVLIPLFCRYTNTMLIIFVLFCRRFRICYKCAELRNSWRWQTHSFRVRNSYYTGGRKMGSSTTIQSVSRITLDDEKHLWRKGGIDPVPTSRTFFIQQ